ncbi:hypothetical protein DPMN_021810, partial [Dreissena polymorpha]
MRIDSASYRAACLDGQMRSIAAKCNVRLHTDAASTADSALTCCALTPWIANTAKAEQTYFAIRGGKAKRVDAASVIEAAS